MDVTLKMGSIFDLQCRSVLILGAGRDRVAREGSTVRECVPFCTEEGYRRALMRPPLTQMYGSTTVCAVCEVTWQSHGLL
jgi:hypothetical protein